MDKDLVERIVADLRSRLLACSAESAHYEIFIEKDKGYLIFTANALCLGKEFERKLP